MHTEYYFPNTASKLLQVFFDTQIIQFNIRNIIQFNIRNNISLWWQNDSKTVEAIVVVVVALLFYVHGKHLRSCRDGQLT